MSGLVPVANVRVICVWPFELEFELKYSRLSMPVSCCSITWVTVDSIVWALAPGYCAVTVTSGGAMSGYESIPMPCTEMMPNSEIRIAMTQAKTGRLMKKLGMSALLVRHTGRGR